MKIAAITDDGQSISQHFGRASHYLVLTIKAGQITNKELREKLGHTHFSNEPHGDHQPGQPHGFDPADQDRHARMAEAIADCQVVLCGGMGAGAFRSLQEREIEPILTDIPSIEAAVQAYLEGRIINLTDRLH
ncbi:MAG TPA: NifB/NifX family molybdenum-iron cluster-binding protein [Anaerolineales bacterium]|jgi:predicted Fe-Mo cluster-binding NifX family protein|nr:NifB/NifX family molybdenum-iron cluster-binding protein [Anaerolineales bacterium]